MLISSKKQPRQSEFSFSTTFKVISEPIGKYSILLISHDVTLDNLVCCKRLRIIEVLDELTFHLLRKDGFGGLWNSDSILDFATIT